MSERRKSIIDLSLDSILIHLGDFGKYQIYVFSLICISVVLHSTVHVAYVFTAMDLDYRCIIYGCDTPENPQYSRPWLKNAMPFRNDQPEKCSKYKQNTTISPYNCSLHDFDISIVLTCSQFVYKGEDDSILKEYDLQCEENLWKLPMVGTINNIGQFIGLFISGIVSDRFGRKVVLVWGMVLCALCGCIRAFMPTYTLFLVFEFLDALFGSGTYICGFVLGVELVGPEKRVLTGTIISCCYAIGEFILALAAWELKSWRLLTIVLYTPMFLLLSYLWLIPESIRWNLSKGDIEECKKTLRKLAKVNGKDISEKELETLDVVIAARIPSEESLEKSSNSFFEAVTSGILMMRLIMCCFCWITCTFLFFGLTLNSVSLIDGNNYLNFILTALVEIPAYFACNFIMEWYGRKKSLAFSYLLTGAACVAFIFIPSTSRWGSLTVYLLGKFGATAAFTVLYVLTSEMFPTSLRQSFMGTCSTFGRCGSMIAPQVPLLAKLWDPLPLASFAGMAIVAGLLTLSFPETLHKKLPDTIEEAENIGKAPVAINISVDTSIDQQKF